MYLLFCDISLSSSILFVFRRRKSDKTKAFVQPEKGTRDGGREGKRQQRRREKGKRDGGREGKRQQSRRENGKRDGGRQGERQQRRREAGSETRQADRQVETSIETETISSAFSRQERFPKMQIMNPDKVGVFIDILHFFSFTVQHTLKLSSF